MPMPKSLHPWAVLLTSLLAAGGPAQGVAAPPKAVAAAAGKPITHDVYAIWRSIPETRLSDDGQWAVYALRGQESDGELVAHNLKTGVEYRTPRGRAAQISADGKFVAFLIEPTQAEKDKAKRDKKKPEDGPKSSFGVMDLATGKVTTVPQAKGFKLPERGGAFVAIQLEPKKEEKGKAGKAAPAKADVDDDQARRGPSGGAETKKEVSDLLLRNLATGVTVTLADVADYAWNKAGTLLSYAVNGKDAAACGVFLRNLDGGETLPLAPGKGTWKSLTFDEGGRNLAFLGALDPVKAKDEKAGEEPEEKKEDKDEKKEDAEASKVFSLHLWQEGGKAAAVVARTGSDGLPEGWSPSGNGALVFSKDGARLYFGSAKTPKAEPKDAPEPVKVDIWHYKDPELQTVQKAKAEEEKKRSYRAVYHVAAARIVQLGGPDLAEIVVNDNAAYALGLDDRAYRIEASWDSEHHDVHAVNLLDGTRRKLFEKVRFGATLSPEGRYALIFDAYGQTWKAASTADGTVKDLTRGLKGPFHDERQDTPEPQRPFGVAGWTKGDAEVLVYDQFDLWALDVASGGQRCVTEGRAREQKLELRYVELDPEARAIDSDRPLILSGLNDATKAGGYFTVDFKGGAPRALIAGDRMYGGLVKARKADTALFTQQSFQEFPDLWASTLAFGKPSRLSFANPQQAEFRWGTQELIEYVNGDGKVLKALLAKPAGFDPKKQYPMMVYIYEGMTDNLHRHIAPSPEQNINPTRFVSNGYLVLRPDIVYETGYPGRSAMKCVLPAIEQVAGRGFVDRARIGIQGHSWGGYQITYLVTQTNLFRAVEAGASVSDMLSAYGGLRYGTGVSRAFQYERSQSRIGGTPWTKPMQFLENSPILFADKVQTPYLSIHNDGDDAVPFTQAIEFFTALRRLGKEAYLFNYNGALHGLRDRELMKHFTVHMCEYFDHYLLGTPRPAWMEQPTPYLERGKRDLTGIYKPTAAKQPLP
jgi:dipeptidyl aminopeptidase/acylaminoacyl peptidase